MASQQLPNSKNIHTFSSPGGSTRINNAVQMDKGNVTPYAKGFGTNAGNTVLRNSIGANPLNQLHNEQKYRDRIDTSED